MSDPGAGHRSGVVALLGLPNAGKSSLLNRWLGEKLAIVTRRPQTTRCRILGILTRPGVQALLLDTPGLVAPRGPRDRPAPARRERGRHLHDSMREAVRQAAADCDVAVLLVDLGRGLEPAHEEILRAVGPSTPVLRVGTKLDLHRGARVPGLDARISARTGEGCPALLERVLAHLPEGPPFYPEDELTDRPLRFLVAETIREAAFECLGDEVPYGVAVEVEAFDASRPDGVRIRARLLVAREAHKPIVVGAGGRKVKEIGIRARKALEVLLERRVHLQLWVKPDPGWERNPRRLRALGYV